MYHTTLLMSGYVVSVIVSHVSTAKGDTSLLCSAGDERWSGVLSSIVRSVDRFFLQFRYFICGAR